MPPLLLRAVGTAVALVLLAPTGATAARPHPTEHSSDGRVGPTLAEAVADRAGRRDLPPAPPQEWSVGSGVTYREWTAALPQGGVRLHLLTADLDTPGVGLDLVAGRRVTQRAPFSQLLAATGATAGVNADFFDIADTGAPLGVGRDRTRGLLHGPRAGWNTTVSVGADGTPRIGTTTVTGEVRSRGRRVVAVDGLNAPVLREHQVGVYTAAWGARPGRHVVDGATRVRQVEVRGGRVVSDRPRLTSGGAVTGTVLIGRGAGAAALAKLRVGQRVRVLTRSSAPADRVVVGGSLALLRAGSVLTRDDGELHPRTAFGYDRDEHQVFLLVADGRSESSSGLTLRQLAVQLRDLGAEDAANLDGGGSSTLVAPDAAGVVGVRNAPSDGHERPVPNGLAIRYAAAG